VERRSHAAAGGDDAAIPVSASTSGSAAVRMITRMVCTTAIADTSAPFSIASMVICDSAPGLPAKKAEVWSQPWMRCK
jgi:C4-dicarboxylate transporter